MKTEQLYEFLVLSRTLNYSRAADALYISQSVLSRHILEMEQELNTSLFFRTTHNVSLTPAGHLLARKAEPAPFRPKAASALPAPRKLPVPPVCRLLSGIFRGVILIFMFILK